MAKNKMIMTVGTHSSNAGKSRGVTFRCNAHTDKKKQQKKYVCRGKFNLIFS